MCCRHENDHHHHQQRQRTDEDVDDSKDTYTYSNEQQVGSEDNLSPLYAEIERSSQPTSNSDEGHAKVTANTDDGSVIYSQIQRPGANSHQVAPYDDPTYANLS